MRPTGRCKACLTLMHNPYQSPNATGLDRIAANSDRHGIDRPMYFVAMLVVVLVYGLFVVSMTNAVWDGTLEPGLRRSLRTIYEWSDPFFMALTILPVRSRLRNIGASGWWSVGMLIPMLNLVTALFCLVPQRGYGRAGKLDVIGRFIGGSLIALFVFLVFAFAVTYPEH